jgi:ABC-2 type transport system permease protein
MLAALVAGVLLFGAHPITVPRIEGGNFFVGIPLTIPMLLVRLLVATAYVAFGYTALLALGIFFSTLTDTPAGAIGATIGVYVVAEILDGITQLGVLRYGLPTHYLSAWEPMFTANRYPHDMIAGVVVQLVYFVVFFSAAVAWFSHKDIRS